MTPFRVALVVGLVALSLVQSCACTAQKALIDAAKEDDVDTIRALLTNGTGLDVNGWADEETGNTALHWAALNESPNATRLLLQFGANASALAKYDLEPRWLAPHLTPLHDLANGWGPGTEGAAEVARLLLQQKGTDVNQRDAYGYTPLFLAIRKGKVELVAFLLERGANVSVLASGYGSAEADKIGVEPKATVLHEAISQNDQAAKMVELLLKQGGAKQLVNLGNIFGHTPLFLAIHSGDTDTVELLLENGADPNAKARYSDDAAGSPSSVVPLHLVATAAADTDVRMAGALLAHGADPNLAHYSGKTALHYAVISNRTELIRLLLAKGANPNLKAVYDDDPFGTMPHRTSLIVAAVKGNIGAIHALLEDNRTEVNAQDKNGWTPLHLVLLMSDESEAEVVDGMVAALLKAGADPNAKTHYGNEPFGDRDTLVPLHVAAEHLANRNSSSVRMLLEHGAQVDAPDWLQKTPLALAAFAGDKEMVELLLEKGANVNTRAKSKANESRAAVTPLHWAVSGGHDEVVDVLLGHGADLEAGDMDEWTPLHAAVRFHRPEAVAALLAAGANPNARAREANESPLISPHLTPLHMAASSLGDNNILRLLLTGTKGTADVEAKGRFGQTPLHKAVEAENLNAVKMLVEIGHANISAKRAYFDDDPGTEPHVTPVMYATRHNIAAIIRYLASRGADLDATDNEGRTALWLAVLEEHVAALVALMENGANASIPVHGKNVLHEAIRLGDNQTVLSLLSLCCEGIQCPAKLVNAPDVDGWTPLHYAAAVARDDTELTNLLLADGADPRLRAADGRTPREVAEQNFNGQIAQKLGAEEQKESDPQCHSPEPAEE